MPGENPGAYDEARKRIRENKEHETVVIEEKKESFEKGKEKIRSRKKLDVFELKRRIETGQSLDLLKGDIREALDRGEMSIDSYKDAIERIEDAHEQREKQKNIEPDFTFQTSMYPLSGNELTKFFESQKLGNNVLIDAAGFVYGVIQGSLFLLWLTGRVILDALLLPADLYKMLQK